MLRMGKITRAKSRSISRNTHNLPGNWKPIFALEAVKALGY
jgi:hypothetical protein